MLRGNTYYNLLAKIIKNLFILKLLPSIIQFVTAL